MTGSSDNGLTRRGLFAAAGSAAAAGFLLSAARGAFGAQGDAAATSAPAQMPLRRMGRTGLMASVIAGNESMRERALLNAAVESGVNYWHKGGAWVLEGLDKSAREKHYIELCLDPAGSAEKDMENFKGCLAGGLEYADFYKIHGSYNDYSVEAFQKLKEAGLARHLSASFHDYGSALKAIEKGTLDQVQISGPPQGLAQARPVLEAAKKADVGVILMKTMNGGEKGWEDNNLKAAIAPYVEKGLTVPQAIAAACLGWEGVTSLVIAVRSLAQVQSLAEGAAKAAAAGAPAAAAGQVSAAFCAVCGACRGACPQGVAVCDIMRFEMYALGYGERERARREYAALPKASRASACGSCGACAKACPFSVASPERIAAAGRMLA